MREILKCLQVHVPFRMLLDEFLDTVLTEGIQPEIGFDYAILDSVGRQECRKVADRLSDAGLRVTFHAPFMDLRPGAVDPRIRAVSRERLRQVFELVPLFRPRTVVCHPSFDARYYVSTEMQWLENSLSFWGDFAERAARLNTLLVLENVYESTPRQLARLLKGLASPHIRFCLDTGHFNAFSNAPLIAWLEELGDFLGEIHLHDNDGSRDGHLPIGEGNFPFTELFAFLRQREPRPILTLEAHSTEHFLRTVATLEKNRLFGLI